MWGNFLARSEEAKERLASALERTGDILTERATAHVARQAKAKKQNEESKEITENESLQDETKTDTIVTTPTIESQIGNDGEEKLFSKQQRQEMMNMIQVGWGNVVEASKQVVEATQKAADQHPHSKHDSEGKDSVSKDSESDTLRTSRTTDSGSKTDHETRQEMLGKLHVGWDSVVEATKHVVEATKTVVDQERHRIFKGPYRRDLSLPLDVDALKDAEVVYITDRLITMGHPAMQSSTDGDITPDRKLAAVGHLLQKRHGGKYMVWNLSEVEYDYSVLDDQVLTFKFPGSPSPPLGLMLKLLLSIESWLKADPLNVAVLHCLTGKGRSSTVLAAFLCWTGEAGFHDPVGALKYIADCKKCSVETLTIPSQRRYAMYFANMLDGVRPHQPPMMLKRVIMSEAPKFGKNPHLLPDQPFDDDDTTHYGCSPYLQLFKSGQLVLTTPAISSEQKTKDELPFCSDGPVCFAVDTVIQGDVLLRCRHLTSRGQRVSMFRAAFHTGYVPPKVLRLSKAQLDGACNDSRFADVFFLDLIFEAVDASMAGKHMVSSSEEEDKETSEKKQKPVVTQNEADMRRMKATMRMNDPNVESAFQYDTMLHCDSRFWDVISKRRQETMDKTSGQDMEMSGKTIGRRRAFESEEREKEGKTEEGKGANKKVDKSAEGKRNSLQSFSIGGGDLQLTEEEEMEQQAAKKVESQKQTNKAPKRDELMEALMALDDEMGSSSSLKLDGREEEMIVFGKSDGEKLPLGIEKAETEANENETKKQPVGEEGKPSESQEKESTISGTVVKAEEDKTTNVTEDSQKSKDEIVSTDAKKESSKTEKEMDITESFDDADIDPNKDTEITGGTAASYDFDYDEDEDDAELDDLENFLTKASGK